MKQMSFERPPLNATNHIRSVVPGLPPPIDVVELLPPSRRSLLLDLRQRGDDAMNLVRPLLDRIDELRTERHLLSARIKTLKTPRGQGGANLDDDDTSVVDAKRKLDAIDAEMARLNELAETRRARSSNIAASVAHNEDWLRSGWPSGTVIVAAEEIDIALVLKRGETSTTALDRLRRRLRELDADQHRIECAPLPSSIARQRMRSAVEQLVERGAPDVSALVEAGHDIGWPMAMTRLDLAAVVGKSGDQIVGGAMGEVVDTMALFAWLHRDALIARLDGEIAAIADDAAALSAEARAEKLAQISSDKLTTEREECALVRQMQDDGMPVEYRVDASPLAVLCIALVTGEPTNVGPVGLAAKALQHVARVFQTEPPDAT